MVLASRSKRCLQPGHLGKVRRKNFDRDSAVQPGIAGAIHFAHAACAERETGFHTARVWSQM